MAITDAQPFPAYGEPFRLPVAFFDANNEAVTGWTGAETLVCTDGVNWVAGADPVEIPGGNGGIGYVDLTGAEMESNMVLVSCSITNDTGYKFYAAIYTADTRDTPGRSYRLDVMLSHLWRRWFNKNKVNSSETVVYRDSPNDTEVLLEGPITTDGINTTRGEME